MGRLQPAKYDQVCVGCGGDIPRGAMFSWKLPYDKSMLCESCSGGQRPGPNVLPFQRRGEIKIDDSAKPLSKYQAAFIRFIRESDRSGQLEALAGSGKSFSIRRASLEVQNLRVKYLVFNTANASAAKRPYEEGGMPPHVDSGTFHSLAWNTLSRHLNLKDVNKGKTYDVLEKLVAEGFLVKTETNPKGERVFVLQSEADAWSAAIRTLVSHAKNHGIDAFKNDTIDEWTHLVDHFGVEFDQPEIRCLICGGPVTWSSAKCDVCGHERVPETAPYEQRAIEVARLVLKASNADLSQVDYDDQLYLTVRLHLAIPQYDIVFVDEAQDTNPTRRALLKMAVAKGGRCISVGDKNQAIFGFTGADSDAMGLIADEWNAVKMPLSICYRCSKAVVRAAQEIVPEIEPWDGAPEGSVETIHGPFDLHEFLPTDAIICRNNAPNVTLFYRLVAAGVPCQILGRDMGQGLVSLVNKLQGKGKKTITLDELLERCAKYQDREVAKWTSKHEDDKAQSITDKCDCVRAVADALPEGSRTVARLIAQLENLFTEIPQSRNGEKPAPKLTLVSAHKSKGMEFERVFILDPWRMPSPFARQAWELEQENHLAYVAATRAQVDLRFVDLEQIEG